MPQNKKKMMIILGAIILIVIIAVIILVQKGGKDALNLGGNEPIETIPTATTSPEEVAPSKDAVQTETASPEEVAAAKPIAVGTSLITKDNVVVSAAGTPVKLNVMPASQDAPKESAPIASPDLVPNANAVKISVSGAGFVPNSFTVKEGQLVNFTLTSTDDYTHVWLPDDNALIATALGVAGGETRVKSWNAPKKGTYTFRCDIPGHKDRGEVGTMIVE